MIHNKFYKAMLAIIISNLIFSFSIMPMLIRLVFPDDTINDPITLIIAQILGTIIPNLFILNKIYEYDYHELFDNFKLNFVSKLSFVKIIFISMFFFITVKSFSMLVENSNLLFFEKNYNPINTYNFSFSHFFILFISFSLIPAIYEELIYRGLFYKGGYNSLTAYILSVIPFIFMHFPFENMIVAALSGTLLFFIREKKNNMLYVIIIHMINNTLSIIFSNYIILPFEAFIPQKSNLIENNILINVLVLSIIFLSSLLILVFLFRLLKKEHITRMKENITDSKLTSLIVLILFVVVLIINFST